MDTSIYSVDRSGFEDRQKNILYLRRFYNLLGLELLLTFVWATCAHYWYDDFGKHLYKLWYIALATGIVAVLLILTSFFSPNMKGSAGPGLVYVLFTLCFMYTYGYCSLSDNSYLVYYSIVSLSLTTYGLAVYSM
jgi:FtsH-binding integral membrane protein